MRILYDGRVFQLQKAGGVNRIYAEVITGLPAEYHPLITGVEDFGRNVPRHPNLKQPRFKLFRPRRISVRVRERWWKPRLLDSLDLFHPTYYELTDGFSFATRDCEGQQNQFADSFTRSWCAIEYRRALADTNAGNQRPCRSSDLSR